MSEDRLQALRDAVADGAALPDNAALGIVGDAELEAEAHELRQLALLGRLFDQVSDVPEEPERACPFDWGQLHVETAIGHGNFSVVYRARDPDLDRPVALKLYRPGQSRVDASGLIDEARQHARIRHPRVLAIHGAAVHDGQAGFWMDHLEGCTLADRVRGDGPMKADALWQLGHDLAQGLASVHQQQMVHGDLKPANVWIEPDGRAVLMDFGAAQNLDSNAPMKYGTPLTMAPELFQAGRASEAADVYALGAVLCFAATGRFPVEGRTLGEIRSAHQTGKPARPPDRETDLPSAYRSLIATMLARRPEDRPGLATVLDALTRIREAPARRFRAAAVGTVVATLALGMAVSLYLLGQTRDAQAEAERELARKAQVSDLLQAIIAQPTAFRSGRNVTLREGIENLLPSIEQTLTDDPLARAGLLTTLGDTVGSLGNRELAIDWLNEALALFEARGDRSSPGYRAARRALAATYSSENRYEEAIDALSDGDARGVPETPSREDLLDAFLLANLLTASGDPAAALTLAVPAMDAARRFDFERQEDRLLGYEALARAQGAVDDNPASLATAREGIAWAEARGVPPRSAKLLLLREFLVSALIPAGQLAEARAVVDANLAVIEPWLGQDDDFTVRNQLLRGLTLIHGGEYQAAVDYLEPVWLRARQSGVISDVDLDLMANSLANAYKEVGREEDALAIYVASRESARERLGEDHPNFLILSSNLAEVLVDMGRYERALTVARETVNLDLAAFGEAHPYTNHARTMMGAALTGLGRLTEAEALLQAAQGHMREALGEQSPHYVQSRLKLATNLQQQRRLDDAAEVARATLADARDALGEDHPYIQTLTGIASAAPP